ncbi:MAG: glycoside hydrolase family 9 protein [Clostridiales bacterium]|nr:glycoside hydrolase family 9 protein [Clostridiales bacterium]
MKKAKLLSAFLCLSMLAGCAKPAEETGAVPGAASPASTGTVPVESEVFEPSQQVFGSSSIDTGNLSEEGNGYEGIEGTGDYNYGEALQMSLLFYELQRSGDLPEQTRCNWRGDSGLTDGADAGLDLTGGLYDAGDHVKFNLPMAYTATMLAWSVYEYPQAYDESGQLAYALGDIRWITDYLIRCHPEDNVYYYQVGDGSADHSWWGPCEVMTMNRPSYFVDSSNPGSAVSGEAAAALAAASIVFAPYDAEYSALCLEHAQSLYEFADTTRSDAGYTAANGFYDSWSGFYDELAWAGAWLYLATGDNAYLENAEACYTQAGHDYNWSMCWDDVHIGAATLLAEITGDAAYTSAVEQHLDFWCNDITYTPDGLAWLDSWGVLRYATSTGFIAAVYSNCSSCPSDKSEQYWNFAESQCNYALGSSGRSYVVGFGENAPEHPHHRTAQGSYCDNMNEPSSHRHTLYGALVGGPDASGNYTDTVADYTANEVACDYNAGFTGLLVAMYSVYHGQTRVDFGAVEPVEQEYNVEASINAQGEGFIEVKTIVYNMTAWPARAATDLEVRYFVDLSELYEAGYDASDVQITTNYMQSGSIDGLKVWNEENHIYYLSIIYDDGALYPGGQSQYKSEVQVRLIGPGGIWDNSNDFSFAGLASGSGEYLGLYEGGELIFGSEPNEDGSGAGASVVPGTGSGDDGNNTSPTSANGASSGSVSSDDLSVSIQFDSNGGNSISGSMNIENISGSSISLSDVQVSISLEDTSGLTFECYHAGMTSSSGQYSEVSGTSGNFEGGSCIITAGSSGTLQAGGTVTVNFSIHRSDWQNLNFTVGPDDLSVSAQ